MTHHHQSKEECKHEKLTYCKECDVVECECGREWGHKMKGKCERCGDFKKTPSEDCLCDDCRGLQSKQRRIKCGYCGGLYVYPHSCLALNRTKL